MTGCSYQTLARYDDASLRFRVKSTDDIRRRQRESLIRLRSFKKSKQVWTNRNLISQSNANYDTTDFCTQDAWSENSDAWGMSPSRSESSSPALSCCSTSSGYSDELDCNASYDCENLLFQSQNSERGQPKSRRQMLHSRKQTQLSTYDPQRIRQDYVTFKSLVERYFYDPPMLDNLIYINWKVIDDAIQCSDHDLATDCLDLLIILVSSKHMGSNTLLFILQQCLMLRLKDTISQFDSQQSSIIELLIAIVHNEPKAAPFVVQLMDNIKVFECFEEIISMGSSEEVMLTFRLYHSLMEPCIMKLSGGFSEQDIILPQILMNTPIESYSPAATLRRIISPNLINTVASRFIKQWTSTKGLLLHSAVGLFTSSLGFIHSQKTAPTSSIWLKAIMSELEHLEVDQVLAKSLSSSTNCQKEDYQLLRRLHTDYHQVFVAFDGQH